MKKPKESRKRALKPKSCLVQRIQSGEEVPSDPPQGPAPPQGPPSRDPPPPGSEASRAAAVKVFQRTRPSSPARTPPWTPAPRGLDRKRTFSWKPSAKRLIFTQIKSILGSIYISIINGFQQNSQQKKELCYQGYISLQRIKNDCKLEREKW